MSMQPEHQHLLEPVHAPVSTHGLLTITDLPHFCDASFSLLAWSVSWHGTLCQVARACCMYHVY